jgi:hypothetical protein
MFSHKEPSDDELAFLERAERLADAFNARYGVDPTIGWTDELIDVALADQGFPALASLPGEPRGVMRFQVEPALLESYAAEPSPEWRRVNAMHLLGHAMLHDGQRCPGCSDWGKA